MRITNNMLINNMMKFVNSNLNRMEKYQTQLATGKKISVPSDDPIVAAKALKLRTDVSEVDQFKRNTNDAYSWMDVTENNLGKVVDVLQRGRELAVQASNGTMTPSDRDKIMQEIKQLKGELIHVANSTYAGRFVFSGFATDSKLLNDDGTYNSSVSSNETAVIKSGLINLSQTAVNTAANNSFKICLDGTTYRTITLAPKNYDGTAGNTLDDLARDIQNQVIGFPELKDIKVINNNGRLEFGLRNTLDSNGNRLKIFMQTVSGNDLLQNIKIKTDAVTGTTVSKSEDLNYQVGISDMLNVNVPGTMLFGSGIKNEAGDFIVSFNRFIDALSLPDTGSYIKSQPVTANAGNPLNLTNNNQFDIKVNGMGGFVTVTIPDPDGTYTYDGSAGKTLNDMVNGIQAAINGVPALVAANVQVVNQNGSITFRADEPNKITLMEGPSNNDALRALKIYTDADKTVSSFTSNEGISNSITKLELMKDRVMSIRSDIGARMNRAELTLNRLDSDEVNFTKLMSDNEDVDMAETIMNLKNEENVYRSSLAGGAKIIMPTLLDFLR
ncbi:MAG: flagellar hook-associated protein FlgL [Clostridia bacterium]|nr:flagellar hook-associated protein FlgL [Clostridia bacterium]